MDALDVKALDTSSVELDALDASPGASLPFGPNSHALKVQIVRLCAAEGCLGRPNLWLLRALQLQ